MRVPTLETERLILRAHKLEDFAACVEMWGDSEVTRHIGGKPSTHQQTWSRMLNYLGHWALMEFGYWALEEKTTGAYVGELGFADFKREMEPSIQGVPELGWALAPSAQGKGYATEGLLAAIAWGDANLDCVRTVCIIDPANTPSIRVAEKCGYREVARTHYKGEPTILFARGG